MSEMFPELPPEEEAAVRDLLASLEPVAEMPPEVLARLDQTIAEQAAVRSTRTRRNVRRLALSWVGTAAAVFVIVAGIGVVGQQLRGGDASSMDARTAQSDSASRPEAQAATPSSPSPGASLSGGGAAKSRELEESYDAGAGPVDVIRPGHVGQDAQRLVEATGGQSSARVVAPTTPTAGCVATREQRTGVQVFPVSYRGEPAMLIVDAGPPRTASVWSCDDTLLTSVPLPD